MPLDVLNVEGTGVNDLPRLPDLRMLYAGGSRLTSLASVAGCRKLEVVHVEHTDVDSLVPLKDCPVRSVQVMKSGVRSLAPLKGKRIDYLNASNTHIEDLSPLAGAPLEQLTLMFGTKVRSLAPLTDCPVKRFQVERSLIDDWEVLATCRSKSCRSTGRGSRRRLSWRSSAITRRSGR